MIVITGARGFIGSNLLKKWNKLGRKDLILVDELENFAKNENLDDTEFHTLMHRDDFLDWFNKTKEEVTFVYHIGARTDTTEKDETLLNELNFNFTKSIWEICTSAKIPLVYASSAATYGDGANGYDDEAYIDDLEPLNAYGWSKQHFDLWALEQKQTPPFWAGLKFFNVYGPGENHKGRMASVIKHAFHQIKQTGALKLFASHNPDYKDGEQLRDFIFVNDVVDICLFFSKGDKQSGIYNVGTGEAKTFNDLGNAVFHALGKEADISYIPTPEDIREKYQYFTEATTNKLEAQGLEYPITSLEEGVKEYVAYLTKKYD